MSRRSQVDVLLVEDTATTVRLVEMIVHSLGYTFAVATTGAEALDLLIREGCRPRLILLDIQLPQLSGLEVLGSVRARRMLRDTPVVALSAHAMPGDADRFLAAGCTEYVSKPIDTRAFAELLQRYLPRPQGEEGGRRVVRP